MKVNLEIFLGLKSVAKSRLLPELRPHANVTLWGCINLNMNYETYFCVLLKFFNMISVKDIQKLLRPKVILRNTTFNIGKHLDHLNIIHKQY